MWTWGSTIWRAITGSGLFQVPGSQVAADGGFARDVVHIMNDGYRAWGALESVLNNIGFRINAKKRLYEGIIAQSRGVGYEKCSEKESECC